MEPDFMLLPIALKTYMSLETKYFARPDAQDPYGTLLAYCEETLPGAANADFGMLTAAQEAYHFRGMMIKWVKPIRTEDNPSLDVLESRISLGQFWVVPYNVQLYEIIDHVKHQWENIASGHLDPTTENGFAGVYCAEGRITCPDITKPKEWMRSDKTNVAADAMKHWIDVVFRPNMQFQTNSIFTGVRGEKTALALMGGFYVNPYEEKAVRRNTTYWEFSCGFLIVRNEHLAWLTDVLIKDYIQGGGVGCHTAVPPRFGTKPSKACLYRYRLYLGNDKEKATVDAAHVEQARILHMGGEWPQSLSCFNDQRGYSWKPPSFVAADKPGGTNRFTPGAAANIGSEADEGVTRLSDYGTGIKVRKYTYHTISCYRTNHRRCACEDDRDTR
jgi:hypothetical protein